MKNLPTRTDRIGLGYLQYYKPHNVWHPGLDYNFGYGNEDQGQMVVACDWGTVEYVSVPPTKANNENGGLGWYIVIRHDDAWTRYMHLEKVFVAQGQKVRPNQEIATLGKTGTASPHLHFEVLTGLGLLFIRDWHRPYGRYWGGLKRSQVAEYTRDPEIWLGLPPKTARQKLHQVLNALRFATGTRTGLLNRLASYFQNLL